ncbi:MAG TPA: hypothetical protein ENI74_06785 [Gammaproteobacteria bacterium]|nr:hypothetical protein [Gammaproteobacteria bacterium]
MSYILEALKKAELQRDIGQVPGIGSEYEKPARTAVGNWIWIVAAVLVLNLVLLIYLLWPASDLETASQYGPGLSQREPVIREPAQVSRPAPVVEPSVPAEPEPTLSAAPEEPKPVLPAPVVEPLAPAESEPELAMDVQPVEAAVTDIYSLPVWPQIPDRLFRQLSGGIHLDVHVYSDLPQDRFVLVNLRKYRTGERLQEGPLVDEITPEGVILSFQGEQFLVRAQ